MALPHPALDPPRQRSPVLAAAVAGDRVLRGLLALTVVVCAWLLIGAGSVHLRTVVFWLTQAALGVAFVLLCARIVRLPSSGPMVRRFWLRISVVGAFLAAADTLQTVTVATDPDSTDVSGAAGPTLLVVAGALGALWAMLGHPIRAVGRERLRWWLDAATIMTGAGAFIWYLLWSGSTHSGAMRVTVVLLGSGLMLVCGFGLIKLLLGGNAPFTRPAGIAGGVAALLAAIETTASSMPADSSSLNPRMALYLLPSVLLTAVPRIQEIQVRADPSLLPGRPARPFRLLPYLAVAATQLLLVFALVHDGTDPRTWGILGAVVLSTSLVVIRQLVAFADNARLLTSLDEAMLNIRQQERRFRSLVQHASDITLVTDREWFVTYASPATNRVLGVTPGIVVGTNLGDLAHPDDLAAWGRTAAGVLAAPRVTDTGQLRVRHAQGSWRWLQVVATNLLDDPSVAGIICNVRDITEARQLQERLRHEATHDPLTRLANRALFDERIRADVNAELRPYDQVGVLVIDLDNFKAVNDTLGHTVGDGLLATVAARLMSCVRPGDTVARLGGDEFAILLPGACPVRTSSAATRILAVLATPVPVEGSRLSVRASIGGAVGLRTEAHALLRVSDQAMYEAKRGGTGMIIRDLSGVDPASRAVVAPVAHHGTVNGGGAPP